MTLVAADETITSDRTVSSSMTRWSEPTADGIGTYAGQASLIPLTLECHLLLASDSKGHDKRDDCRHGTDDCHSRHHDTGGNQTTRRCYRNVVAIADRRQGGERPPQRVTPRADGAIGPLTLDQPQPGAATENNKAREACDDNSEPKHHGPAQSLLPRHSTAILSRVTSR